MKKYKNTDEYISAFPPDIAKKLSQIRIAIKEEVPQETTEKISYGMPTFYLNGNLVHFAAFKDHIGFFPAPSGIESFKKELSKYQTGKGTLQFPYNKEIPFDLIKKVVRFRLNENINKKKVY